MPNGGSDCCGTCWFNAKNKGQAGYDHSDDPEPDFCDIRELQIEDPFYTYCGNHPHRRSERDPIPLGPVFTGDSSGDREFWRPSPDTEKVRQHLLTLLGAMEEQPDSEYPIGIYTDEVVVWQLGEFGEARALEQLRLIASFRPGAAETGPFGRTREGLVRLAKEALDKIECVTTNDTISKVELAAQHCSESVDRVAHDPETTAFKRRARFQQAMWRESHDLPIGTQPTRPKPGGPSRPLGSRIEIDYAHATGANFLTEAALEAVRHRVANPEPKQTLYVDRLYADMLSSMPMCFNLFGPVSQDMETASTAVSQWWPDAPGSVQAVRFEWSPGRQIPGRFLENRSAFDVAFELTLANGASGVIAVETKYHEDCRKESRPSDIRMRRYEQVTAQSGIFRDDALDAVVGTHLQQIWLDHLLALSMLQDVEGSWTWAKFVLVHPEKNPSFARAAEEYAQTLLDSSSFETKTLESLLDADALPPDTAMALRERYIW